MAKPPSAPQDTAPSGAGFLKFRPLSHHEAKASRRKKRPDNQLRHIVRFYWTRLRKDPPAAAALINAGIPGYASVK